MRQRSLGKWHGVALLPILALLGACGGDTASTPTPPRPDAEAGHESASDAHLGVQPGSTEALETDLITAATRTAEALTGSDWGLIYDLSCPALVGDQSRESYVAGLSAAGSPAQLAGGTLTVGSPTAADGINASELPVAAGEVRWVQMLQDEAIIGVARFVDAGDGFRYCGLSI